MNGFRIQMSSAQDKAHLNNQTHFFFQKLTLSVFNLGTLRAVSCA